MSEQHEIVAEHYHTFENIPVCICVIETARGFFVPGVSASALKDFDPEIGKLLARRNANRSLEYFRSKGRSV